MAKRYRVIGDEHRYGIDYVVIDTTDGRECANYGSDYDMAAEMATWGDEHPGYFDPIPVEDRPVWGLEDRDGYITITITPPEGLRHGDQG